MNKLDLFNDGHPDSWAMVLLRLIGTSSIHINATVGFPQEFSNLILSGNFKLNAVSDLVMDRADI